VFAQLELKMGSISVLKHGVSLGGVTMGTLPVFSGKGMGSCLQQTINTLIENKKSRYFIS
jgi:hypothetical protein